MRHRLGTVLATVALGSLYGCATQAPEDRLTFEEQVALYSEEVLGLRPDDETAIAVGSDGCEIEDDLRDEFDELLPISAAEESAAEERHAPFGIPEIDVDNGLEFLLHHNEYVLGYNADLKVPMYATYLLEDDDVVEGDRRDCFREDHRLEIVDQSTPEDYDEPIFDQGHLVPVGDMHREFSTSVNTFYMSNMMPQSARFNRGVWKFLEGATRLWAVRRGSVLVLSGPVFDRDEDGERDAEDDADRVMPQQNVGIPSGFFKIIVHETEDGDLESMTFLLPHTFESVGGSEAYVLTKFATINEVEALTGYDFFPDLSAADENELESFKADDLWLRRD